MLARYFGDPLPLAAAGDAFFLTYLVMGLFLVVRLTHEDLDRRASEEDEGIVVIFFLTLAGISFSFVDIFTAINAPKLPSPLWLVFALAGAPLGWATLHTISAFHYAHLHYLYDEDLGVETPSLKFPGTDRPGPWDFLYFSFVLGMTAQVSDVMVQSTRMRKAVLWHSVVAFFFNTVLIAMAVNAVVAVFQASH